MAPTSNKRPDSSHVKENGGAISSNNHAGRQVQHTAYAHSKENSKGNGNNSKSIKCNKELEILDFHESWLEEMEIYKDQLYIHKHNIQQMLGPHNHAHTVQGCQLETIPPRGAVAAAHRETVSNYAPNMNGLVNTAAAVATIATDAKSNSSRRKGGAERKSNHSSNEKNSNKKTSKSPRVVVRNAIDTSATSPTTTTTTTTTPPVTTEPTKIEESRAHSNAQLLLKRHREESTVLKTSTANHSKRPNTGNAALQSNPAHPQLGAPSNVQSPGQTTAAKSGPGIIATNHAGAKASSKITVNPFHASSLLSSHHLEETRNILTQNGLTRSAATAYETSLYASNYLNQDNRAANSPHPTHYVNWDYNYVGVSLAGERSKDSLKPDDDPCAAIDDVHAYSDSSESDDEYQGQPFFLDGDGLETKQSMFVRQQSDTLPTTSSESTESDTTSSDYYRPKCILTPSLFPNVPPYLNFSSHAERGPAMPASLHKVLKWKLSPVMPKIVKRVVLNSGFRIIKNTTDWMAVWEKHMKSPGFRTIRSHQKYNHMPGSFRIGRKDTMWRSIQTNMRKHGSREFGFMQKSYIMPDDLENLRQAWPKNASKLTKWIVKPPASARGTGIRIVNKWSQFPKDRPLVVQKYIERPLLINDNKFDMRIYVFITSINPLRIYMYKDGLARFASVKYSPELTTLDDRCMHLTNYSINKYSENYSKNEDFNACQGHKWTLQSLWSCLEKRSVNTKRLWATLRNLVIKAIISGESGLNRMYRQNVNFRYNCYELFGFDVLLDENLVPWLLEINISPSLHSELPLDLHVKGPLIQAVLNTALYQVPPKLNEKQQQEIVDELNLKLDGPLCLDKRIFTTCLTPEEIRKHNQFTNRTVEFREEYIDTILDNLLPDDVRCLILAEDEFARCKPLERIFPTTDTYAYLKFIENPRYYNRLLDAWEHRYGHCREEGIALLRQLCRNGYHLQVSDATLEKEPNVSLTEIDMLHVKKSDDSLPSQQQPTVDNNIGDSISAVTSKAGSPESNKSYKTNVTPTKSTATAAHTHAHTKVTFEGNAARLFAAKD